MPRVFISHSTRDRDDVERRIVGPLREGGIDTWYSRDDIQTGAMWDQTIREGLESCDWFLLVMSPRSEESEWVRHELFWAMQHRPNRIIPVRIADCDPWRFHMALPRIQHIDFPGEAPGKLLARFGPRAAPPANLCPNPACGVVNPPGERTCLRCATPIPFPAGTLLHGRYQIQKHIGTGGFGAVYLAADTRTGADVAVKEMLCSDPQEFAIRLNFFRREAEVLRQLHRLDITARFFDLIEEGKAAHLVMEFVRGRDLLARMEANGNRPFAFGQVVEWGKAVCDLMTAAHTQDPPLILRQMKPDDMILLEDLRSIKFVDFGTARDLGGTPEERLKSKTRVYVEGYAPPEQIIGKPEPRSDLFALAATLFHLITGKAPEGVHTAKEVEAMLAGGAIRTEQRWLYELIRINLSEDIGDRYHTAREIKRDLEMRQVTRKVRCGGCKHVNEVRTPFCAGCERPLTEMSAMPCPGCLAYYRLGSRRCASCSAAVR